MVIKRISQAAIGLMLLVPSYLLALSMGDISLDSSLYQPLQATIPISDIQNVDMSTVRASLGSEAQFKQAGITRSDAVKQLQFTVKADTQGKAWVSVTSKQAIVNSNLQFIVRLSWPYGETMRWYTLNLAPSSTSSPDTVAKMKANAMADAAATTAAASAKKKAAATAAAAAQAQVSTLMTQQLEQINTHLQTVQVSLGALQQANEMLKSQLDSQNQAMQQLQQQVIALQTPPPAPVPVATAPAKPAAAAPAPEDQGYRLKTWQAFLAAFVILFIILRMVAVLRRQGAQAAAAGTQPAVPGASAAMPEAPVAPAVQPVAAAAPTAQAPPAPAGIKPTVVMQAGQPNVPTAPPKPRVVPITELRKAKASEAPTASMTPGTKPPVALAPAPVASKPVPTPIKNDGPRPQMAAAAKPAPVPKNVPAMKPTPSSSAPLVKPIETKKVEPTAKLPIVTPTPGDNEYSSSTVENRHATQLDLAQAYISMGDYSAAKKLLKEVIAKADGKHKKEAQQLLEKIPAKKGK